MKIGFLISNSSDSIAGLERYQIEILRRLVDLRGDDQFLLYKKPGANMNHYDFLDRPNIKIIDVPGGRLWKHLGMLFVPRSELYLFCDPNIPIFLNSKKIIVVVHDVYHFIFKKNNIKSKFNNFVWKRGIERAAKVVAVSNNTKDDLLKYIKLSAAKIKLIYNGFNKFKRPEVDDSKGEFFLAVGTVKPRKNILNIVKAFTLFTKESKNQNTKLLIVGKYSASSDYYQLIYQHIKNNNIEDRVIFLGNISDKELSSLYYTAYALVFVSSFEGFGFPILEAMYCGAPVITSNIGSMKELAEDSALLADPKSPKEISQQMLKIYNNQGLKEELITKGQQTASYFSWQKASQEMSDVIDQVYEK